MSGSGAYDPGVPPVAVTSDRDHRSRFGSRRRAATPVSMFALLARFAAAGLLVSAALAVVIGFVARDAGTAQAIASARQVAWLTAQAVIEPHLTPELLAGEPAATAAFDATIRADVLKGSLVRVKLWNDDGEIVYSDDARLIGSVYPLGDDEMLALRNGEADSEISDLTAPENRFEVSYGKLLEVYTGIVGPDGQQLLFETYFVYDAVAQAGEEQWLQFAPPALGALLVLELVQIPFAWSLARRIQRHQRDAERLLQHAVDSSHAERRRIAADLHDGIVQQLTGLTFALDAARLAGPDARRDTLLITETAAALRRSTGDLRSLLVDIYPPNLAEEGLPAALTDLAQATERAGVTLTMDLADAETIPSGAASVLFRSAQEILRNVNTHSRSHAVSISVTHQDGRATLVVDDDGRGFEESQLRERRQAGHVGLRGLGDLIADADGRLTVRSAPGQGTRVEVEVPTR